MPLEAQVLSRVCRFVGESQRPGTGFLLDVASRQYLITANHLTCGEPEEFISTQLPPWYPNPHQSQVLSRVGLVDARVDVAVFACDQPLASSELTLPAGTEGLIWSQDAYVVGYPLNLSGRTANGQYGIPVAKKGIVAAMDLGAEPPVLFLDLIANPGLSGAPVVYWNSGTGQWTVGGVVTQDIAVPLDPDRLRTGPSGLSQAVDIRVALTWIKVFSSP